MQKFSRAIFNKKIITSILSVLCVAIVLYLVDVKTIAGVLVGLSLKTVALASVVVTFANLCIFVRSRTVLKTLGFDVDWRSVFLSFSASNVASLPLNVLGQSLTRAMILARAGVPFGMTVFSTYIERLIAAGLLFLFSLISLWVLFGNVGFDWHRGGRTLLWMISGMIIVGAVVGLTQYRRQVIYYSRLWLRWVPKLWLSGLLTIIAHAAGLVAYLILLSDLAPQALTVQLIAALTIVMFATSLPISFAGFGLRELSAASVLVLVGMTPETSVAAALAIGVLYLGVTGLFAAIGLMMLPVYRPSSVPNQTVNVPLQSSLEHWDANVVHTSAVICAVLMFFRLQTQFVSTNDIAVNINMADVVNLVALSVILLMLAAGRIKNLLPPFLTASLGAMSALFAAGLFNSYSQGNLGNWALYSRGVGWLLMLGYTALGAATLAVAGERARLRILRTLATVALVICILQIVVIIASPFVFEDGYRAIYPIQGFANNQNAFSFELTMVACLMIATRASGLSEKAPRFYIAGIVLYALTVYLTGSRTGVVFVFLVALLDMLFSWRSSTRGLPSFAVTGAVAAVLLVSVLAGETVSKDEVASQRSVSSSRIFHEQADVERLETWQGAITLFSERPIIGSGIGAYVESMRREGKSVLGIHSVYLWFLGEMGILGLLTLLAAGGVVAKRAWSLAGTPASQQWGMAIFAIVAVMAIGGLVQDFFFQRIFWFVLGLTAAGTFGTSRYEDLNNKALPVIIIGFGLCVFLLVMLH